MSISKLLKRTADAPPAKRKPGWCYIAVPDEHPTPISEALAAMREQIDSDDLMGKGLEEFPHCTVRFGLVGPGEPVIEYLKTLAPFEITLGETMVFPPSKSSDDASVVVVAVESPELTMINTALADHGEWTPPDFDYKPHMTVAYVTPESAAKYEGMAATAGATLQVTEITVGVPGVGRTVVKLEGNVAKVAYAEDLGPSLTDIPTWEEQVQYAYKGDEAGYINLLFEGPENTPPEDKKAAVIKAFNAKVAELHTLTFPLDVYRALRLKGGIASINHEHIGTSWSWDEACAQVIYAHHPNYSEHRGGDTWVLHGRIDKRADVNWGNTVEWGLSEFGEKEKEICLNVGAAIEWIAYREDKSTEWVPVQKRVTAAASSLGIIQSRDDLDALPIGSVVRYQPLNPAFPSMRYIREEEGWLGERDTEVLDPDLWSFGNGTTTVLFRANKTASPDYGYSSYHDCEHELGKLKFKITVYPGSLYQIIAREGKTVAGSIQVDTYSDGEQSDAFIRLVEIEDKWRGSGLGQILYDKAIEEAKTLGMSKIFSDWKERRSDDAESAWKRLAKRYPVQENAEGAYYIDLKRESKAAAAKQLEPDSDIFEQFVAVDLDGTLAEDIPGNDYSDPTRIGPPIALMVKKIRHLLDAGYKVKIFTARMADEKNAGAIRKAIADYTEKCIGEPLEATCIKTPGMIQLWDDKARQVVPGTGKAASVEVYTPDDKYFIWLIPEIRFLPISAIQRDQSWIETGAEVATVSDEVAANMDFSEPVDVTAFRYGRDPGDDMEPVVTLQDGHHRYAAALQTGRTWLPVRVQARNAKGYKLNALIALSKQIEASGVTAKTAAATAIAPGLLSWFGDSKVVNEDGSPCVVYHGSRVPYIVQFDLGKEGTGLVTNRKLGAIWFTSERENASWYADYKDKLEADTDSITVYGDKGKYYAGVSPVYDDEDEDHEMIFTMGPYASYEEAEDKGQAEARRYNSLLDQDTFVTAAYLRIENPLYVDKVPRSPEFEQAKSGGHDGIIAKDVHDGAVFSDIYVVFSPSQIKSADQNSGAYSRDTHDIRASKAAAETDPHSFNPVVKKAMNVTVPPDQEEHFWQEPAAGMEEFWAFRWPVKAQVGDQIIFKLNKKPIAEAVISRIERPGQTECATTGRFKNMWKVYWTPESFKKLDKTAAKKELPYWDGEGRNGDFPGREPGGKLSKIVMVPLRSLDKGENSFSAEVVDGLVYELLHGEKDIPAIIVEHSDRKGRYTIIDGHHRYEAAKLAGYKEVPVRIYTYPHDPYLTGEAYQKTASFASRLNSAEMATLKDIETRTEDYDFLDWLKDLIGDDTNPTYEEVLADEPLRLDYLYDWLGETDASISVEEHGYVTFYSLDSEARELIGGLPVIVYHHTSSAILQKIKKEGLRADVKRINTHQNSGAGVYVTTEVSGPVVNGYHTHAVQKHRRGGSPVTLAIKTYLDDLEPDPDDADIRSGAHQFILPYVAPEDILFDEPETKTAASGSIQVPGLGDLIVKERNTMYFVFLGKENVATASLSDDRSYLVSITVEPKYRRKGIATALYAYIEQHIGHPLRPSPNYQSQGARAVWKKRETKKTAAPFHKNAAVLKGSAYPSLLPNGSAIASYIESVSSSDVDEEMMEEYFRGCHAELRELPIDSVLEGDRDHNIPSPEKEKRYQRMPAETMPPIVVENGVVVDGNHRLRVARKLGLTAIWCYVVKAPAGANTAEIQTKNAKSAEHTASAVPDISAMTLYHGTKSAFDTFDLSRAGATDPGLVGKAIYFCPDREQAEAFARSPHYGRGSQLPRVIAARVHLKKPYLVVDGTLEDGRTLTDVHPQGITKPSAQAIQKMLRKSGYDGVVFMLGDEVVQVAVFDPLDIEIIQDRDEGDIGAKMSKLLTRSRGSSIAPSAEVIRTGAIAVRSPLSITASPEGALTKMAAPLHEEARDRIFYHGTASEAAAQSILQNGIQPREITMPSEAKSRAQLAPARGRVYLTNEIKYAAVYALGGAMFGHKDTEKRMQKDRDGNAAPYGYIFAIDGEAISGDVVPDEDSIGEMLSEYTQYTKSKRYLDLILQGQPERYQGQKQSLERDVARGEKCALAQPDTPSSVLNEMNYVTRKFLTDRQYENLGADEVSTQAAIGKKLQKHLSASTVQWMLDHGAHAAHLGAVYPSRAWRFKKEDAAKITAADVLSICEEIPVTSRAKMSKLLTRHLGQKKHPLRH